MEVLPFGVLLGFAFFRGGSISRLLAFGSSCLLSSWEGTFVTVAVLRYSSLLLFVSEAVLSLSLWLSASSLESSQSESSG